MEFYSVLLWAQFAYSLWQFVREAKFFRLPYIIFRGILNFTPMWVIPAKETLMVHVRKGDPISHRVKSFNEYLQLNPLSPDYKLDEEESIGPYSYFRISNGKKAFVSSLNLRTFRGVKSLIDMGVPFVMESFDVLAPNLFIFNLCSEEDVIRLVRERHTLDIISCKAFIDVSSKSVLNKDFLRLISMFPLILQAKNYNLMSAVLSGIIIQVDLLSVLYNRLWQKVKWGLLTIVKLIVSLFGAKKREFLHSFMTTISKDLFYCDMIEKKAYIANCDNIVIGNFGEFKHNGYNSIKVTNLIPLNKKETISFKVNKGVMVLEVENRFLSNDDDWTDLESNNDVSDLWDIKYTFKNNSGSITEDYQHVQRLVSTAHFINSSDEDFFVCKTFSGFSMHLYPTIEGLLMAIMYDPLIIKHEKSKRNSFLVSDSTIDNNVLPSIIKTEVFNRMSLKRETKTILIKHCEEFLSEIEDNFWILFDLIKLGCAKRRPLFIKNSRWKRYTSDVLIIMNLCGEIGISSVTKYPPSKTLKEILEKKEFENFEVINEITPVQTQTYLKKDKMVRIVKNVLRKEGVELIKGLRKDVKEKNCMIEKTSKQIKEIKSKAESAGKKISNSDFHLMYKMKEIHGEKNECSFKKSILNLAETKLQNKNLLGEIREIRSRLDSFPTPFEKNKKELDKVKEVKIRAMETYMEVLRKNLNNTVSSSGKKETQVPFKKTVKSEIVIPITKPLTKILENFDKRRAEADKMYKEKMNKIIYDKLGSQCASIEYFEHYNYFEMLSKASKDSPGFFRTEREVEVDMGFEERLKLEMKIRMEENEEKRKIQRKVKEGIYKEFEDKVSKDGLDDNSFVLFKSGVGCGKGINPYKRKKKRKKDKGNEKKKKGNRDWRSMVYNLENNGKLREKNPGGGTGVCRGGEIWKPEVVVEKKAEEYDDLNKEMLMFLNFNNRKIDRSEGKYNLDKIIKIGETDKGKSSVDSVISHLEGIKSRTGGGKSSPYFVFRKSEVKRLIYTGKPTGSNKSVVRTLWRMFTREEKDKILQINKTIKIYNSTIFD